MAIRTINSHFDTIPENNAPDPDVIYYAYAHMVVTNYPSLPNIMDTAAICTLVEQFNNQDFEVLVNQNFESNQILSKQQKWKILTAKFNTDIQEQLNHSLLKKDKRTIFFILRAANEFSRDLYQKYFGNHFVGMSDAETIYKWLHRFEIFLCCNGRFTEWLKYLEKAFAQRGTKFTALDLIKTEKALNSIMETIKRLYSKMNKYPNYIYAPALVPMYDQRLSLEDSLAMIQAWLDSQTEQVRLFIQPKLQQAISQLKFREKRKEEDKVPINSYLPSKTAKAFEMFRKQRGLNKEEALNILILRGLGKDSYWE